MRTPLEAASQSTSQASTVVSILSAALLGATLSAQATVSPAMPESQMRILESPVVARGGGSTRVGPSAMDIVLPAAYAGKMGNWQTAWPHSRANMRYQQVFRAAEVGGANWFTALCLRLDESFGGPAGTQSIELYLGGTTHDEKTLTDDFAGNYDASLARTKVFDGTLALPAYRGGGKPSSFDVCLKFDKPIYWPGGTGMIVELINKSTTSLSPVHNLDYCQNAVDCTTTRAYALDKGATKATSVSRGQGLIMKLVGWSAAREPAGLLKGVTTRWLYRPDRGEIAMRLKHEWVRLHDKMHGVAVSNHDVVPSTPDSFRVSIYLETTPTSNMPAKSPIFTSFPSVLTNGRTQLHFPPISLPSDGRDVFLAVEFLSPYNSSNYDGGWISCSAGAQTGSGLGLSERPGRRLGTGVTNRIDAVSDRILYDRKSTSLDWTALPDAVQLFIEPLFDPQEAFPAAAVTKQNQSAQPGRYVDNKLSGVIGGLLSGLHPDAVDHNAQTTPGPRNDSAGFCVEGGALRKGDFVVFMIGSGFIPPKKVSGIKGALHVLPILYPCIRLVTSDRGPVMCLPPTPSQLAMIDIYWQGMVVRPSTSSIVGFTSASIQRF